MFHFYLFRELDKRLLKAVWEVQRKLPAVFLYANVVVFPNEFLRRKMPAGLKALDKKATDADAIRRDAAPG